MSGEFGSRQIQLLSGLNIFLFQVLLVKRPNLALTSSS